MNYWIDNKAFFKNKKYFMLCRDNNKKIACALTHFMSAAFYVSRILCLNKLFSSVNQSIKL